MFFNFIIILKLNGLFNGGLVNQAKMILLTKTNSLYNANVKNVYKFITFLESIHVHGFTSQISSPPSGKPLTFLNVSKMMT